MTLIETNKVSEKPSEITVFYKFDLLQVICKHILHNNRANLTEEKQQPNHTECVSLSKPECCSPVAIHVPLKMPGNATVNGRKYCG